MEASEGMVHANWKIVADNYRKRLQEIHDTIRWIELRHSDTGSDAKAALAKMTEADYTYIRRQAIVP